MANTLRQKSINKILYISIGSAIGILILFIILFNIFNSSNKKNNVKLGDNNKNSEITIEQASTQIGKSVNEASDETVSENLSIELSENNVQEDLDLAQAIVDNNTQEQVLDQSKQNSNVNEIADNLNTNPTAVIEQNTSKKVDEEKEKNPDPVFTMPIEGEIVKQYGKEKLIYSETLKEWTTHLGIDIKAEKTSIVKASADGVIKSIKNDPRYGLTIVIEHNNGYKTIYSNLLSTEFVKNGENVKSGQTIGTVGNSATFEILDEPHLHFEITKDGENLDPEMCIQ